jgi:hypothetical protein
MISYLTVNEAERLCTLNGRHLGAFLRSPFGKRSFVVDNKIVVVDLRAWLIA